MPAESYVPNVDGKVISRRKRCTSPAGRQSIIGVPVMRRIVLTLLGDFLR